LTGTGGRVHPTRDRRFPLAQKLRMALRVLARKLTG
jgi:hypothetical protein